MIDSSKALATQILTNSLKGIEQQLKKTNDILTQLVAVIHNKK